MRRAVAWIFFSQIMHGESLRLTAIFNFLLVAVSRAHSLDGLTGANIRGPLATEHDSARLSVTQTRLPYDTPRMQYDWPRLV